MNAVGIRKAALLLTALDSQTAAELLKSAHADTITRIAAELTFIRQGGAAHEAATTAREFFQLMFGRRAKGDFVREVVENALGKPKGQEVLGQVTLMLENRDPFRVIREAAVGSIAKALEGESAQVAALVLGELSPKKSADLLGLLEESVRRPALRGMTAGEEVSPEARLKVASIIRNRLDQMAAKTTPDAAPDRRQQQLRKVAVLLRGLKTDFRDNLIAGIQEQDKATADLVRRLMVIWDDLPLVADRSLQNVLRNVDSRKLSLSLVSANPQIGAKIRANISERAAATLDEETSLLNNPKPDDIDAARELILGSLRELNDKGELPLEEK